MKVHDVTTLKMAHRSQNEMRHGPQQNNGGKRFFVSMKNISLRLTIR